MTVTYSPMDDLERFVPANLPASWSRNNWPIPSWDCHGTGLFRGLRVMMDAGYEEDGKEWLHVSVSRAGRRELGGGVFGASMPLAVRYETQAEHIEGYGTAIGVCLFGKVLNVWFGRIPPTWRRATTEESVTSLFGVAWSIRGGLYRTIRIGYPRLGYPRPGLYTIWQFPKAS